MTIAVPVSWHIGSTPPAEMAALRSRSMATNRSLPLASGSSTIARSCARCSERSRCWMSVIAVRASSVSVSGSISRNRLPAASTTRTPSAVTSRYSVLVSLPSGRTSVWLNSRVVRAGDDPGPGVVTVTARAPLRVVRGLDRIARPEP